MAQLSPVLPAEEAQHLGPHHHHHSALHPHHAAGGPSATKLGDTSHGIHPINKKANMPSAFGLVESEVQHFHFNIFFPFSTISGI